MDLSLVVYREISPRVNQSLMVWILRVFHELKKAGILEDAAAHSHRRTGRFQEVGERSRTRKRGYRYRSGGFAIGEKLCGLAPVVGDMRIDRDVHSR